VEFAGDARQSLTTVTYCIGALDDLVKLGDGEDLMSLLRRLRPRCKRVAQSECAQHNKRRGLKSERKSQKMIKPQPGSVSLPGADWDDVHPAAYISTQMRTSCEK
jgi:hypothetical protein